jgi:chromosome transmission fidelity protein 4
MLWDLHTCHVRFERELLFVQIDYDTLDEELTMDTIVTKERALDKEIIQLIQMACKDPADTARALELTKLLHNIPSIDAATKIAEFYHLAGLKEKMQTIKADNEEKEDRLVTARNKRRRWLKPEPVPREIQSVNGRPSRADPLAEPYPLPNVERPGMARVIVPVIESSQYTKNDTVTQMTRETSLTPDPVSFPDSKRKRSAEEESQEDDFVMPPPKSSAFCPAKTASFVLKLIKRNESFC